MAQFPWLTAILLLPLLAAALIPIIRDRDGKTLRWYALSVGIIDFSLMVMAVAQHYDFADSSFQLVERYPWIPQLGLNWSLAIDGLSAPLILLTGLVNVLAIAAAFILSPLDVASHLLRKSPRASG